MGNGVSYWRMVGLASMLAVLAMAAMMALPAAAADEEYVTYAGTAEAAHSSDFIYGESHTLHFRGKKLAERVVLYTCRDGRPFARKTVAYTDATAPDFALEDVSVGLREGVRGEGAQRRVFFQEYAGAPEKSAPLPRVPGLVADAGFDDFVRSNWDALMAGRKLGMAFLVPSRLETMSFDVAHVGSERVNGIPAELFRLRLTGILGMVLPSIDVYYDTSARTLVRYVGLSDLRDKRHNNFDSDINFPPADRRASDAMAMQRAREAPLIACR